MKHKNGFNPLSRTTAHRRALHRNMVTSLFKYERITTTKQKAMEVRRTAEKLITRSKVDTFNNRRHAAKYLWDNDILKKLFTEIGPRMKDRNGGYTRILKIGFREGDAADVAILELVDYDFEKKEKDSKKKEDSKKAEPKKSVSEKKSSFKPSKPDSESKKGSDSVVDNKSNRRYNRVKGS
ncbi:50S ribosomal protein L17 [Treponema pedis]|uniref:Large ribosomal subunit protein bL17 n=1 Tax=Treponema pedis TaxID=409322 RepID=A0A7S6WNE6_9SPIR|nr:50S ribosomal protein L17 [Treponema pedis]QOW60353.1 50S ribosomal protein L17 [Treponema pedis]